MMRISCSQLLCAGRATEAHGVGRTQEAQIFDDVDVGGTISLTIEHCNKFSKNKSRKTKCKLLSHVQRVIYIALCAPTDRCEKITNQRSSPSRNEFQTSIFTERRH